MLNDLFREFFKKKVNAISDNRKDLLKKKKPKKCIVNFFKNYYSKKLCLNILLRYYLNIKLSKIL